MAVERAVKILGRLAANARIIQYCRLQEGERRKEDYAKKERLAEKIRGRWKEVLETLSSLVLALCLLLGQTGAL